jgi:hypothetical protein
MQTFKELVIKTSTKDDLNSGKAYNSHSEDARLESRSDQLNKYRTANARHIFLLI